MHTNQESKFALASRLGVVFLAAFLLNALYEHLHAPLYAHYQGGVISEAVLLHATLADALIISALVLPFLYSARFARAAWLIIPLGIFIAVDIEWWALGTARWAYGPLMPVIPFLGTGLTPTIQLGLLGYLSYLLATKVVRSR